MDTKKIVLSIFKTCLIIAVAMVIIMIVIKFSAKAYDFGYRIFDEEPMTPAPGYSTSVAIVEGKSVLEIGKILEEKGLVRSAYLFYCEELVSDYHGMLRPGVYQLSTSMTPFEMMVIMSAEPEEIEETDDNSESSNSAFDGEYRGTEDVSETPGEGELPDEEAENEIEPDNN